MWNLTYVGDLSGMQKSLKGNQCSKKGVLKMEILNLVLFGCVFYLAIIGIPTLCEKKGK